MRFFIIITQICKGIYKGVRLEVRRLSEISNLNSLLKQQKEELRLEYERLGEYMYCAKEFLDEERVQLLYTTIGKLLAEIKKGEEQLAQIRDG